MKGSSKARTPVSGTGRNNPTDFKITHSLFDVHLLEIPLSPAARFYQ